MSQNPAQGHYSSKTSPPSLERQRWLSNTAFVAYVAGLVDGEGCLSLIERTNEECVRRSFSFRLSVEMGDKAHALLTSCQARLGGTLQRRPPRDADKHQGRTVWNTHTKEALPILEAILPHMIVKREQCRLCITACKLILEKPENFEGDLNVIKSLMHELNATGPQKKLESGWIARLVGGEWLSPQGDLLEPAGLAMFSGPWPPSGIMRNGAVYQQPALGFRIGGTASGLLPTLGKNEPKGAGKQRYRGSPEFRGAKMSEGLRSGPDDPIYLHPVFAEQAMGFPTGWTELEPSETRSSRKSPNSSGEQS